MISRNNGLGFVIGGFPLLLGPVMRGLTVFVCADLIKWREYVLFIASVTTSALQPPSIANLLPMAVLHTNLPQEVLLYIYSSPRTGGWRVGHCLRRRAAGGA